jgi:mono/diheme cytochrome c family protein
MRTARLVLVLAPLLVAACRQDMHDQPRLEPLEASGFFLDGQGARLPVPGTVARGALDNELLQVAIGPDGQFVRAYPITVTASLVARGRERYAIYCAPCHGALGNGLGMIVRRGFKRPESFHSERLRAAAPGSYYDVMTNGLGNMPSYAAQVKPRDRWAITAYIQALQLSQRTPLELLDPAERERLPEAP